MPGFTHAYRSRILWTAPLLLACLTGTAAAQRPETRRWLVTAPGAAVGVPDAGARVAYNQTGIASHLTALGERSPFLRRQLARLHGDERVALSISIVDGRTLKQARAVTTLTRLHGGRLRAEVVVGLGTDMAELLGHELEHVLERLDGVHVPTRHRVGDGGARPSGGHRYETVRARLAGRIVADECASRTDGRQS